MNYVNDLFSAFLKLAQAPWLYVGHTRLNLLRVLGLLFIAFFAWWLSSAVERTIRRMHVPFGVAAAATVQGTVPEE